MTPAQVSSSQKQELSTDQWLHIAREAIKNGTLNLLITGGEPFIRDDFAELYTEINKMGFLISINTNGSLMNDKYYDLFSKYPPASFSVTLYGADRETYQNITGNADNFDKTINGLQYISKIKTVLEVKATFIEDNKDQLDRLRETANRFTKNFAINYMVFKPVPGVSSHAEKCRLTAKECVDIDISNTLYYSNLRKKNKSTKEKAKNASFEKKYAPDIYPQVIPCLSAKAAYWISWDGRMLPCGTFDAIYTEPLKEGFKEAWERLPGLLKDVKRPEKCVKCKYFKYCPNCPAYFYMETGRYDEASGYICKLAHERNQRYEELYRK